MSFSFNSSLPSWLDHMRLALGDTDPSTPLLDDETIDSKISSFGYLEGLAQLADALAVKAAQDPDKYGEGSAGLVAEWSQKVAAWRQLAADCRAGRVAVPLGAVPRKGVELAEICQPRKRGFRAD